MTNKMRAIHPSEILRDELEFLGLSANRITTSRSISAETA